jgi:hypothetical protein
MVLFFSTPLAYSFRKLNAVWDIPLGKHKGFAGNPNDPLIRPATGRWRQHSRSVSNIRSDYRKVTVGEFKNVRAASATDRFCSIGVRVRSEPAKKHGLRFHAAPQSRKRREKARIKYSAYTVVHICGFGFF